MNVVIQLPENVPQHNDAVQNANSLWSSLGGICLGSIAAIALGLIFGPLAALAGYTISYTIGKFLIQLHSWNNQNVSLDVPKPQGLTLAEQVDKQQEELSRMREENDRRWGQTINPPAQPQLKDDRN